MRRPLHYLLLQPAPVTHKPQHSHESSGPQDHHPSFYLSIPSSIHLYIALYNPLCLSLHIPMSHSFRITHEHHHPPSGTCTLQGVCFFYPPLPVRSSRIVLNFHLNSTHSCLSPHIWLLLSHFTRSAFTLFICPLLTSPCPPMK